MGENVFKLNQGGLATCILVNLDSITKPFNAVINYEERIFASCMHRLFKINWLRKDMVKKIRGKLNILLKNDQDIPLINSLVLIDTLLLANFFIDQNNNAKKINAIDEFFDSAI